MIGQVFCASIIAALTAAMITAGAAAPVSQSEPVLLIKPLPAGIVPPTVANHPPLPKSLPDAVNRQVCLTLDIRADGTAANLKILQSSGDAKVDGVWLDIATRTRYRPATMSDTPITVRLISVWGLEGAKPPAGPCTWERA